MWTTWNVNDALDKLHLPHKKDQRDIEEVKTPLVLQHQQHQHADKITEIAGLMFVGRWKVVVKKGHPTQNMLSFIKAVQQQYRHEHTFSEHEKFNGGRHGEKPQ